MQNFYVLDVGHGNSAVLIDDDGVVVIDAGPKLTLLTFLIEKNITTIDVLLLSHSDKDHIAGAINLLTSERITVKQVYVNSDSTKNSVIWDDLVYLLSETNKKGKLYFSIRDNERQFPTKEVVDTVEKNLDNVRLFSTRSSEVLGRHIEKTCCELLHQDGVGHIHLDLESLKLKFIK